MSDYFAFRFFEPSDDKRKSLAIFFSSKISLDLIAKALKDDVTKNLVPKNVYLISADVSPLTKQHCCSDEAFVREFDSYIGEIESKLHCISFDKNGVFLSRDDIDELKVSKELQQNILHSGMLVIFKKHAGLVESKHGYHFIKPSGDHCDKFIRASNLLVMGVEVTFLAVSLLPFMHRDLRRIYVDTSSISFLISTAIQQFENFDNAFPTINSFASYAALDESYDFVEDESSLILISATTSGSLAKRILSNTSFPKHQVITLFHINLPSEQTGVFDVSEAINGRLISSKEAACSLCKRGDKLIRIAGDQFLPENPKHDLLVIKKSHFSREREEFFGEFAARNFLGWNYSTTSGRGGKEHFFVDVELILSNQPTKFSASLLKNFNKYLSRDLETIISLDDEGSKVFSQKVREHIGQSEDKLNWLAASEVDEKTMKDRASVLVLAGAITSGRSLLSIARKLRCIDPSATITYMVAFSKLPSKEAYEQLRKDLSQGGNNFIAIEYCPLPRVKEYTKTAWDWEREVLQPFGTDDPLGDPSFGLPTILANRVDKLLEDKGDKDALFLVDPNGHKLKLRRTFAFWSNLNFSDKRLEQISQSDVYWTIQAVLHDLRNQSQNSGLATPYHTTLISPANFDRYNDGLIQACLLRAAHPIEMDYRLDKVFSRQMTDVISSILTNWDNAQGEAVLEFLMALWTGRICLTESHLREVLELRDSSMTDEITFILDRLSETLLG